jgi:hypothetical protein
LAGLGLAGLGLSIGKTCTFDLILGTGIRGGRIGTNEALGMGTMIQNRSIWANEMG